GPQGHRSSPGKWLLLIGACSGWAAITRPVDALILAIPVGVALLIDLGRATWPTRIRSLALPILAAIPFLAIQATLNRGVTGLFALRGSRWLLFSTLPLFILGYVGWAFFLEHYNLVIIPAVVLLVTLVIRQLSFTWRPLGSAALAFVFVLALTNLYELNHSVS